MKTSNVEPHGTHAAQATRGSRSALLAGAKGMVWRDASTESEGQIRDMTVRGGDFQDNEDGTGVLTIGAGDASGEGGEGVSSPSIFMLNNSDQDLGPGSAVVVDETADRAVTVTDQPGSVLIAGIVQDHIAIDATGRVLFNGYAAEVLTTGDVARGQYAQTSDVPGAAQATDDRESGSFGVFLSVPGGEGFISDSEVTESVGSVTSLSVTMPASVTDGSAIGRVLFLALFLDQALGAASVTLSGWNRIGSTSGFRYYYRYCTGTDTAAPSWTGSSPAAAAVLVLDDSVSVDETVEDFDYDDTTSAAAVSGLSDRPRYAIAAVHAVPDTPAGWTALVATNVLTSSGGAASDLLSGVTLTQDPSNTTNWANPANVNDGSVSTNAGIPWTSASPYIHKLVADLGAPASVSTMWGMIQDGGGDALAAPEYSDDGSSWTTIAGSWSASKISHNGGFMRQFTITGAPISHRYFRAGKTGSGIHVGYGWYAWEIIGTVDTTVSGTLVGKYIARDAAVTSPFTGASEQYDAVFALNLTEDAKASVLLYGPDLGGGTADDVSYDNATSGLTAVDVQAAIDEVAAAVGAGAPLNNFSATAAPTVNDDTGDGYSVGSRWIDTTNDRAWTCVDASSGAAVWLLQPAGGSGGGWISYTPTWTASTTNPTLSNGTLTGHYRYLDAKTIAVRIKLTIGSSTNNGSGNYSFSLPLTTDSIDDQTILCRIFRATGSTHTVGVGTINPSSTSIVRAGTSNNIMSNTTPFAWGTGDQIRFQGVVGIA